MPVLRMRGFALPKDEPIDLHAPPGPRAMPADGAQADAVVYDADPRTDPTQLDKPRAVITLGRRWAP